MNWKHVWISIKETCIFRPVTFILNSFKTWVASILFCTFNSIILDPIKGWSIVLKFTTIINEDEGLTELSREYNSKYLLEGWIIITSFIKITMITAWICMFFTLPSDDPSNARAKVICPTIISVLTWLDESFKRNLFIKEFLILLSVFGYGWVWINGNSKKDSYYIYEFWFVYYWFAHSASIFTCINWK